MGEARRHPPGDHRPGRDGTDRDERHFWSGRAERGRPPAGTGHIGPGGGERAVTTAVTLGFLTGALGGQSRRGPWEAGQVVALAAANAIAVALAAAAWWATSGMDRATSQIGWSGVALCGVVIALA